MIALLIAYIIIGLTTVAGLAIEFDGDPFFESPKDGVLNVLATLAAVPLWPMFFVAYALNRGGYD